MQCNFRPFMTTRSYSMTQLWRRWHRHWHSSVLSSLRSSRSPVDALVDRQQPALSRIYGWIVDRKRRETRKQRIASHVAVLSVGNVTFGATGKTPFVQFLVDYVLKQTEGEQVPLLLSRGYGDDEWRMLATQFPACHVALGSDRVKVGRAKVKEIGEKLSCIVLDDGLQQWGVAKDLEIVMVDALHPLGNGLLIPCGSLRELPREALARADVVVVHHAHLLDEGELKALLKTLQSLMNVERKTIVATSRMKVGGLVPIRKLLSKGELVEEQVKKLDDCSVLVVCGVGNPESVNKVVETVARWSRVEMKAYPDHHAFTSGDALDILQGAEEMQQAGDVVVVTTEKDFARSPIVMKILADKVDLRVLRCELELQHNGEQVKKLIDAALQNS